MVESVDEWVAKKVEEAGRAYADYVEKMKGD